MDAGAFRLSPGHHGAETERKLRAYAANLTPLSELGDRQAAQSMTAAIGSTIPHTIPRDQPRLCEL